jgi:hypothetical protein
MVPALESVVLKEFFWETIFGREVRYPQAPFGAERLKRMREAAVKEKLADVVIKGAA